MHSSLIDINLTDLRGFISFTDSRFGSQLSEMSLVALKTRLQLYLAKNQFTTFSSFNTFLQLNEKKHEALLQELIFSPGELFRDYDSWLYLVDKLKSVNKNIPLRIGLIESGNYSDTITLLILLDLHFLIKKCELSVIELHPPHKEIQVVSFNSKELEAGVINFGKNNRALIERYFIKKDKKAEYRIPLDLPMQNLSDCIEQRLTYDILIARNHTLPYNFAHHEILFEKYLKLLHRGSMLFTGNKEGFKWCQKYITLQPDENYPFYTKN